MEGGGALCPRVTQLWSLARAPETPALVPVDLQLFPKIVSNLNGGK